MMSGGWRDPRVHTLESLRHFFASAVAWMGIIGLKQKSWKSRISISRPSTFCSKRSEETRKHAPVFDLISNFLCFCKVFSDRSRQLSNISAASKLILVERLVCTSECRSIALNKVRDVCSRCSSFYQST